MIGVACNSQIPQANLHAVLNFVHVKELQPLFYSYLKVLKSTSVSVVENEQSNSEITFAKLYKKVCCFLKHIAKGTGTVTDYLLQELQR
jgi:hypothetical protein